MAPPFAVTRLWLDRDVAPERPTFSAISREPTLDSVTVYSRLERPSAQWAARTGGSVVELHSYACTAPDVDTATARMRAELARAVAGDGGRAGRPPAAADGGDGPHVPAGAAPAAARRRAVRRAGSGWRATTSRRRSSPASWSAPSASGVLAANDVLAEVGAGPEPIRGVPQRGLLAGLLRARSRP